MADNKVTIDADYFAELYARANQLHNCDNCKEVHTRTRERDIAGSKYKELVKERDELKANLEKLADFCESNKCVGDKCVLHDKFAAAEKCINKVWSATAHTYNYQENCVEARRIISAYRKAKGATE